MRQPSRIGWKREPENQHCGSPSSKSGRRVNPNVAGGKDSHLHRASLARAARVRGGKCGMARLGRGRAQRRTAIRARSGPDHRNHRSLFEEASTRRRVGIAEAARWADLCAHSTKMIDGIRETENALWTVARELKRHSWKLAETDDNNITRVTVAAPEDLGFGANHYAAEARNLATPSATPLGVSN